jgi:hypothetical protein
LKFFNFNTKKNRKNYPTQGVEIRTTQGDQKGLIPPLPTHRGNVFQHSFVWTNYWDEPEIISNDFMNGKDEQMKELGVVYEGCPGEDRERHYFHCATIWRPLREVYVNPVRLELGASSIMSSSKDGGEDDDGEDDGASDGVPTEFYEPQVIVIVTKLPYHESFGAVLRAFMQVRKREKEKVFLQTVQKKKKIKSNLYIILCESCVFFKFFKLRFKKRLISFSRSISLSPFRHRALSLFSPHRKM